MKSTDEPIAVEQSFDVTPDEVWCAITDVGLMRQWYFDNIPDFKPQVGFETRFNVTSENRNFLHMWKVTEVVPGRKIVYEWRFKEYPGESTAIFDIVESGKTAKLRLTVLVHEDFPDDIPEFTRESCIEGWKYFINGRLKTFLDAKV